MLTDGDIKTLAGRMGVPLAFVGFKSDLPNKILPNKSYIINMDNEVDTEGSGNTGSHWTCFQVMKYPNNKTEAIYFDSFGMPPPEIVKKRVNSNFYGTGLPYNTKDIQSLMNSACGWYCLAFLHFINESPYRQKSLYADTEKFLEMFDDLNKSIDFKKNEYVLKHFFQAKDPALRKGVDVLPDVDSITDEQVGGLGGVGLPGQEHIPIKVDVKYV
jgi:hypothetical protein